MLLQKVLLNVHTKIPKVRSAANSGNYFNKLLYSYYLSSCHIMSANDMARCLNVVLRAMAII